MELEDHDEAHGHDEPWLVSFADLMTLLFGFFVIMYSFATAGDEEFEKIRKELAQHFGGEYMTPYEKLKEDLTKKISASEFEGSVEMQITDEGLKITFRSTVLFSSGSATLYLGAEQLMNELVKIIAEKSKSFKITVEGHTDNVPIRTKSFPSNWTLSGARAATVVMIFEKLGFKREKLNMHGFGDTAPAFPHMDESGNPIIENRAKNRRVVIHVLSTPESLEEVPKVKEESKADESSEAKQTAQLEY